MINIHDNELVSYIVDLKKHKIILDTMNPRSLKKVNIVFLDVLAHFFQTEIDGSVIFDIQKASIIDFFKNNRELIENQKGYCWPMQYDDLNQLAEHLEKERYNYYIISASYGLSGWILAKCKEEVI